MDIQFLDETFLPQLHRAINLAFRDYAVPFQLTFEQFQKSCERRGTDLDLSVAAIEDDVLVGFLMTAVDPMDNPETGYNQITGVIPSARGKGLAKQMVAAVKDKLRAQGFSRYLLEVISTNQPAVRTYEAMGFRTVRNLNAYQMAADKKMNLNPGDHKVQILKALDWPLLRSFWDWRPGWQNHATAVDRARADCLIFGIGEETTQAYAVLFPENGDVAQLAVRRDARGQGMAQSLFAAMSTRSKAPLRWVYLPEDDRVGNGLAQKMGMKLFPGTYEMVCPLN